MREDSPHALCITSDPSLRKTLRRTLQAAGSTVEFMESVEKTTGGEGSGPVHLVVVDQNARRAPAFADLIDRTCAGDESAGAVIVLGESLEDDELVALLKRAPLDHVISDADSPDETELVVTSVKLITGDIFGLEKYLSWGVKVHELEIDSYEQKRSALLTASEHARQVGARRQVIAKIESVCDELLMNAMYDAPAVSRGEEPQVPSSPEAEAAMNKERALLRYACDGRYFAVSVEDRYGQLQKSDILDNLSRARASKGKPRSNAGSGRGAGLGLYFIMSSVTRFIANILPGKRTEVIGLFDLRQSGREAEACAKSMHIFHERLIASGS